MDALADIVTIEVSGIPKGLMRRLAERARTQRTSVSEYVRALIESDLNAKASRPQDTLAEILAPVHEDFARSGMTEEELYGFFDELREKVWQEKHGAGRS